MKTHSFFFLFCACVHMSISETAEAAAIAAAGLPPARPGFNWAAYCKSIDGHLSVSYAVANVPSNDYDFEQIPIYTPSTRPQKQQVIAKQ